MKLDKLMSIVEDAHKQSADTLFTKNKEYASENDVLKNFQQAQYLMIQNVQSPAAAAWNMSVKHLISIKDLIENPDKITVEMLNEKFGDEGNYLHLIKAALIEDMS